MLTEVTLLQVEEYHAKVQNLSDKFIKASAENRKRLVLRMLFGSSFVLCLRDFRFEHQRAAPVMAPGGPLWSRRDALLSQLVADLQPLKVYSPAQPEMLFPDKTISWIYLSDSEWETKVRLYMIFASLIVIVVDKLTPGIRHEIRLATDPLCSKKTVVFIAASALEHLDKSMLARIRWKVPLQEGGLTGRRPRDGQVRLPEDVRKFIQSLPTSGIRGVQIRNLNEFDRPEVLDFCESELLSKRLPPGPGIIAVDVDALKIRWTDLPDDKKTGNAKTIVLD